MWRSSQASMGRAAQVEVPQVWLSGQAVAQRLVQAYLHGDWGSCHPCNARCLNGEGTET